MQQIAIADVHVGNRLRKDLGDLKSLQDSIRAVGQLHPIVLDSENNLIAGERRLEAMKRMGKEKIGYVIAHDLKSATALLLAERDENTERKKLAPSEAVAIGKALEKLERKGAKSRQSKAGRQRGKGTIASGKLPEAKKGETREHVGKAVGMSGRTYEKARAVSNAAEEDPEAFGDLVDHMDATGKVSGSYEALRSRRNGKKKTKKKKRGSAVEYLESAYKDIGYAMDGIKANSESLGDSAECLKKLKLARSIVSQVKKVI